MKILSHRGLWTAPKERNTRAALEQSLEQGFGFESDIRDYGGHLVISHDPAVKEDLGTAETVFQLLEKHRDRYCFAINIKADGIGKLLAERLKSHQLNNYFCFDMSVPQMIEYAKEGIRFFTRKSEYEPGSPVLLEQAAGVWIDAFEDESWITKELLEDYLSQGKEVCLVSPELHARKPFTFWKWLKDSKITSDHLFLCTDLPREAKIFFEGGSWDGSDKSSNF